ncbi:MAG: MurR/RpiR family transcriptional regulator [Massilimicrobiota sp.]|uniref:MurR/RpiR family transcriptional regulator n=1 Tax=Massilimicrobiota sp. SW1139 TaxID=2530043 RepID=UPI00143B78A4|nr:MurR/RpiR family transcriptional regulator [Massilimicrobiota sp. SW1139]MEE0779316.1 MurR/RpiR family transcriptional regulator [Massilimicrobiota sp.]NJE45625.1 MurR/RpiR family transcriptional regulator [Massilimicrobiota sp. SW1139]
MLIHKIEKTHFSPSESIIIDYILKKGKDIKNMTIAQIANETYTSSPLFIRIAKKLGFDGWNEFKEAYLKELDYLYLNQEVDANIPFVVNDDIMNIAYNLCVLERETIQDTYSLISHDDLQKAIRLLRDCKYIDVYSRSVHMHIVRSFQERMYILHRHVQLCSLSDELDSTYLMSDQNHCAIIISYSGHAPHIKHLIETLRKKQTSIIAITNLEDNELSLLADVTLRMSSRELIYTKIADFASSLSLKYILDILYSCIFSIHYQQNLDNCIQIAKELDNTQHEEFM